MAHLSLYRKYRSQTFLQVIGQEHVTRTLKNAVVEGRTAHAYLFSGPRGTGKTSTARILAKALNCEKGAAAHNGEPCNECTSCREVTEGTSLDVVEIDAASHGSVDDARELREKVAYAPVAGRRKVYIIDECHMLSPAANNALLKVLEEPPSHVVFVFATTEPHKVLQTLLDRCQRYEFRAIDTEALAEHLVGVCESEDVAVDDEAITVIASRALGSARDALSLLEQLLSFAGTKVTIEDVRRLLGSTPEDLLVEAVDLISERDAGAMLAFTDRLIRSGRDIREFVRNLVDHLRALFLIQHATAAQEILDLSDDQLERLRAQSNHFDHSELLRLLDLANETQLQLREAVETRLALEIGLARMTRPDLHGSPASLLSRIERLERVSGIEDVQTSAVEQVPPPPPKSQTKPAAKHPKTFQAKASEPEPQPVTRSTSAVSQEVTGPLDIEKVRRAWEVVVQKVKKRKISFSALLIPARPSAWEADVLVLEFSTRNRFHRDQVAQVSNQAPLVEAFFETFGVRPQIRCVISDDDDEDQPQGPTESEKTGPSDTSSSHAGTMKDGKRRKGTETDDGGHDPVDLVRKGLEAEIVEEI